MRGEPRLRCLALLRRYGVDSTSFQGLERGFSYWFDEAEEACVAYVDTGASWVAAGGPIAEVGAKEAVAMRFVEAARKVGRRACFFAVEEAFARKGGPLASMPIGEEPSWDPSAWPEIVRRDRKLKEQLRRARAKGVVVRTLAPEELGGARARITRIVDAWLSSRKMPPMGFLVGVDLLDFAEERRWFLAEQRGSAVGLLVAVPIYGRKGWLFEDLLRLDEAPNGTNELLIDTAMRHLAEEGSRFVTLGLAPLAGTIAPVLRRIRAASSVFYDFEGLRRFKAKLRPHEWRALHLAWPRGRLGALALVDALSAFTIRARDGHRRGSFLRFGLETLAHAPGLGLRLLALLLFAFTLGLAFAETPLASPMVRSTWIVAHGAVAFAMLSLARRWRSDLARALAIAISADAALTVLEVLFDMAPRARSSFEIALLAMACAGPMLAAFQLWSALVWRQRWGLATG